MAAFVTPSKGSSPPLNRLAGGGRRLLRELAFGNPLYALTLGGRTPTGLRATPPNFWPGDTGAGRALVDGELLLPGRKMVLGATAWAAGADDGPAREALHGFGWLRDLWTLGTEAAKRQARTLTADWIERHARWQAFAWRPDILGERLANWFTAYGFLAGDADPAFREILLGSMARQSRHLARVAGRAPAVGDRTFLAVKGLVYAGICLPDNDDARAAGVRLLEREIGRQILADGGHVARSPAVHLAVLRHLLDIRGTLTAGQAEIPPVLQGGIDRMAPMLRGLRLGDGRLALFNGGGEDNEGHIDTVLAESGARGRALSSAPHSGFQRLAAGRTIVLVDAGPPPPPGLDGRAHAGALSFEMSSRKRRLIVNCGAQSYGEAVWRAALRATAAHSTLTVADLNSAEILADGSVGRRPVGMSCARQENEGNLWLEMAHDGYRGPFGLTHRRRLYLAASGEDLRGEDSLLPATTGGGRDVPFALRFHLHPEVKASMVGAGGAVLLWLSRSEAWRFLASAGEVGLEESVYVGGDGAIRRSEQIVVRGATAADGAVVKWAIRREPRK